MEAERFPLFVIKSCSRLLKATDLLFFIILLVGPIGSMWIDRETGEGRFLTTLLMIFSLCSVVFWKRYYYKWSWALALYLLSWCIGLAVDLAVGRYGNRVEILVNARQMLVCFVYMIVAYNMTLRDSRNIKRFLWVITIAAIITAFFLCMGIGTAESTERGIGGVRYKVFGQNENGTSRMLAHALLFVFLVAIAGIRASGILKMICFVAIPICLLGMLRCASRGGVVFLAASFPFCLFTAKEGMKKLAYMVLIAVAMCGLVIGVLSSDMLRDRFIKTIYDRDTGSREFIFYSCLDMFKKHPICGYGLNNHRIELGSYQGISYRATHCTYTYPLVAMGVAGSIPYFIFMTIILLCGWRIRQYQYGNYLFMAIIFSFLSGVSGNLEYARWMFVFFGVAQAAERHMIMTKRYAQNDIMRI